MMHRIILVIIIVAVSTLAFIVLKKIPFMNSEAGIRYIALGDSYTIGLGVAEEDRWPNILTNHLKKVGINIHLVANTAVSGYTVKDASELELGEVERGRPDFVTVLIGANDNFGQKEAEVYRRELRELLDKLQPMVTNPKNIVLITIPDYSKSPVLKLEGKENISKLIEQYNKIIKEEGKKRDLKIADIFSVSQTMTSDSDYVSDGLHPSAQSYVKWERIIFPVVFDLLNSIP